MQHKAIVDHTLPALCTPITRFPAYPTCSEHVSNGMIPSAARCYWRWNDPFAVKALQCIVSEEENPQMPFPWDFVTMLMQHRATAIGNMHRKIGKDRVCVCVVPKISW